ncbi:MAG TPA: hypothetical protein VFW94_24105 [Candidatus Acidoferrales bacterium]|nr:hypothetical protein [Candidatus Acidoferrales bacterium]
MKTFRAPDIENELRVDRVGRRLLDDYAYPVHVCCGKCHMVMVRKLTGKYVPVYYHGKFSHGPQCVNADKVFHVKPIYLEAIDPKQWEELGIEGEKPQGI